MMTFIPTFYAVYDYHSLTGFSGAYTDIVTVMIYIV